MKLGNTLIDGCGSKGELSEKFLEFFLMPDDALKCIIAPRWIR